MYFSSFIFCPGTHLVSDDEFSSRSVFIDDKSYTHDDSDHDLDSDTDLLDHIAADLEELNKQNIRDKATKIYLPNEATRIFMDLQSFHIPTELFNHHNGLI